ncbi:RICIN domain-containing protein [Streptomyces sp. NPDC012637]|uniref:RICIN domain-containing protein n=1 Tax=Streptomyces sp. NPDC012637 TaxID=3364842 RepID=UPI0036EA7CC7
MRKTFALAAAAIGMIGMLATAPGAAASDGDPSAPAPVTTANLPPTFEAPDAAGAGTTAASASYMVFANAAYGTCMDDSSAHGLRMHECSVVSMDNGYQRFSMAVSSGYYKFRNVATGKCLDGSTNYGVRTHTCSDASFNNGYQKWTVYNVTDGWVSWKNAATGQCIDYSANNGLRLHTCSTDSFLNGYQAWSY